VRKENLGKELCQAVRGAGGGGGGGKKLAKTRSILARKNRGKGRILQRMKSKREDDGG